HVAADPVARTATGVHTYLLDMNPATTGQSGLNDAGLTVGQTYTDPAGSLTITNMAMSNSSATIQVTYTSGGTRTPTCRHGSALTAPGPTDCSMGNPTGTGGAGGSTGTGGSGGSAGTGGSTGRGGAGGTGGSTGGSTARGGNGGAVGAGGA